MPTCSLLVATRGEALELDAAVAIDVEVDGDVVVWALVGWEM